MLQDETTAETIERIDTDTVHRTEIEAIGLKFRASYQGDTLVEASADPEHDAARALLARGLTGQLRTRWKGSAHDAIVLDIEKAAKWSRRGKKLLPFDGAEGASEE